MLAVLDLLDQTCSMKTTTNHFYPTSRLLHTRETSEGDTDCCCSIEQGNKHKLRAHGIATVLSPEQESEVVRFVSDLREDCAPMPTLMLCTMVKEVANDAEVQSLSASRCWVDGFKARNKVSMKAATRQCQCSPAVLDRLAITFAVWLKRR
ncbi:hypothetical protein PybrP1_012867 [[Pythium] brassicae (nom. inval.)]|nr:hypothetical protein PybrP1_012867 [[Pythium] brassicae (nom. inval.)]